MAKRLEGKVVVVTGGGGGIGRAVAVLSASEGAKIVVNDFSRGPDGSSAADKTVAEIMGSNSAAASNYDSVTSVAGGEKIIKSAIDAFGRVDVLVNCAGNDQRDPNLELSEEDWDRVIDVHLKGHFACAKAAIPHMIKQQGGRIINISSKGAFFSGSWAYGAAKAGVMGLTASMARQLAQYGITVNCILPSAVTPLFPHSRKSSGDGMPVVADLRPRPESIAPIIVYLASDEGKGINGRFFYSSGGDICVYAPPFTMSSANTFIRKTGEWTVDELSGILPPLAGA